MTIELLAVLAIVAIFIYAYPVVAAFIGIGIACVITGVLLTGNIVLSILATTVIIVYGISVVNEYR